MLLPQLREEVHRLHAELPKNKLVAWTSGNISARDPETGLVVIKPSGVRFEDLTPANMVVALIYRDRSYRWRLESPSSDTASHCAISIDTCRGGEWRGAYAFALCDGVCPRWRGDTLCDNSDGG